MYGSGFIITYCGGFRVRVYGSDGKWTGAGPSACPRIYEKEGWAKARATQVSLPPGEHARGWLRVIPVSIRYNAAVSLWDIIKRPFKRYE